MVGILSVSVTETIAGHMKKMYIYFLSENRMDALVVRVLGCLFNNEGDLAFCSLFQVIFNLFTENIEKAAGEMEEWISIS